MLYLSSQVANIKLVAFLLVLRGEQLNRYPLILASDDLMTTQAATDCNVFLDGSKDYTVLGDSTCDDDAALS